ncbi:MAG: hypothetical protein R2792_08635 [Saprospiraceae bacterium]
MKHLLPALLFFLPLHAFGQSNALKLYSGQFRMSINDQGQVSSLFDLNSKTEYLVQDTVSYLASIRVNGEWLHPVQAQSTDASELEIDFGKGFQAVVAYAIRDGYFRFGLTSITQEEQVEVLTWGPFHNTISSGIGETVGVAQCEQFALCIQSLNIKTLGGYPWNENDCMPQIDIFEQSDPSDLKEENKRYVLYRVEAAKPTRHGSSLQAYCRNRNKARDIENWGFSNYLAPAFDDGGLNGTAIALLGCHPNQLLATIGTVEQQEGLPHPMLNGQWAKTSPEAAGAYLILGFGEEDIEKALDITQKAGLKTLYHPGPFETWGHFKLNTKQFPDGRESLKKCVERAESIGVHVGVHTLSNFITTNDPYVSPIPDKRLAVVGSAALIKPIDEEETSIHISDPIFFNQFKNNTLRAFRIDDEIIRYGSISDTEPWILKDCVRGAFGTQKSTHVQNSEVAKLADHAYKVFLTNPELSIEMAGNLADLFNEVGLRQISFDGLEGNRSTGMGNYGEILFTQTWYDQLDDQIKAHYIADASRTSHFFWHMYTRMNWGEPWYAGIRESQTAYRMKNQAYFKRNLMPRMLGWFNLTAETSLEDIEWMLARSAAYDAGYGLNTNYKALEANGASESILKQIALWEKVRLQGAFSAEQKKRMENLDAEFHLEELGTNSWLLHPTQTFMFEYQIQELQPGAPTHSAYSFENAFAPQQVHMKITALDGLVSNIHLELDQSKSLSIPIQLNEGESLVYKGGDQCWVLDKNWNELSKIPVESSFFHTKPGPHQLDFDAEMETKVKAKIELRLHGKPERVGDRK